MKSLNKSGFLSILCANVLALLIVSFAPTTAQAGVSWGIDIDVGKHHGRDPFRSSISLREHYIHRHHPPRYYRPATYTYIFETAPFGSIVYAIPAGCRQYVVNGTAYFEYFGTYYVPVAGGYQVVPPPAVYQPAAIVAAPTVITPVSATTNGQETFTVNVPDSRGGYTAVNLRRSGSGFTGPQGEFYSEFPKIDQLRVMYTR